MGSLLQVESTGNNESNHWSLKGWCIIITECTSLAEDPHDQVMVLIAGHSNMEMVCAFVMEIPAILYGIVSSTLSTKTLQQSRSTRMSQHWLWSSEKINDLWFYLWIYLPGPWLHNKDYEYYVCSVHTLYIQLVSKPYKYGFCWSRLQYVYDYTFWAQLWLSCLGNASQL